MIAPLVSAHVLAAASSLSAAPQVLAGLSELLEDPNVDVSRIADQIRLDPTLAVAVVRVSNSVAFGGSGGVASVDEAVSRVGLSEVVRLVGVATVGRLVDRALPGHAIASDQLRESVLFHALATEALARRTSIDPRVAYTAGLLRAIGIMVVERVIALGPTPVTPYDNGMFACYQDWEKAATGLVHEEAAVIALEAWHCPAELVAAVRTQTHFVGAPDDLELAGLINLAGAGLAREGFALPGDEMFWDLTDEKLQAVGLDQTSWGEAIDDAARLFERLKADLF